MYIRSYSTYISAYTQNKTNPSKEDSNSNIKKTTSFNLEKAQQDLILVKNKENNFTKSLQENHIPTSTIFRQQKENKDLNTFTEIKKYQNAQLAYSENATLYSLAQKPKRVIGSIKIDLQLPQEAQVAKASLSKKDMINTYLENENYYRITAA